MMDVQRLEIIRRYESALFTYYEPYVSLAKQMEIDLDIDTTCVVMRQPSRWKRGKMKQFVHRSVWAAVDLGSLIGILSPRQR